PPDYFRPELNGRRGKQVLRQRYNVEIVVKVRSKPAMLGTACHTRMAFAIVADTAKGLPSGVSEEDVGPKNDGLSYPSKAPAGTRQLGQIHRPLNRHEKIDVLRDGLSGCQGAQKCNAPYTRTEMRSPHKGISPKK